MALETPPGEARPARYVGQSIQRVEDPRLLAGKARFLDDIALPGMLHASFVRSPHAHARVTAIDTSAALALDGVVAVFTGADLSDDMGELVATGPMRDEVLTATRKPLATETVRHVGDPVAVVVATTPYLAEDGRDLVEVEWEPLPAVVDPEQALEPGAPLLDESLGTNNIAHIEQSAGDVERAFADADHVISKRFVVGRSTGAPLEGRGIIAEHEERGGGHMTIYVSSQMPHLHRLFLAPILGMPEGRIRVIVPDVGGAFGLKCTVYPEDAVIPAVARRLGRPVKWIEDRWENLATTVHSKGMVCSMDIAADADGTFRGFRAHFITDGGGYSSVPFTPVVDSQCAAGLLPSCYAIDAAAYTTDNPLTNKCQIGAIRGVGWMSGQLIRETTIDDVARALDLDPVERAAAQHDGARAAAQRVRRGVRRRQLRRLARARARHGGLRGVPGAPARAARAGALHRRRLQPVRRADGLGDQERDGRRAADGLLRHGQRDDGARRVRHGHDGPALARPGPRDDARAGRRRRARRADRDGARRLRRHRQRLVGHGDLRQPQRGARHGLDHGGGRRGARAAAQARRDAARGQPRGPRAARRPGRGEGRPEPVGADRPGLHLRLLRRRGAPARGAAQRAHGHRRLRPRRDVRERVRGGRRRGRRRDGHGHGRADRRRRGLRRRAQPDDRPRPDRRRGGAGRRDRAARGPRLRRGRRVRVGQPPATTSTRRPPRSR